MPLIAADHFDWEDLGRVRSGHDKWIAAINVLLELRLEMLLGRYRASVSIKRDLEHFIIEHFLNWSRIGCLLLLAFLLILVGRPINTHRVLNKILFLL